MIFIATGSSRFGQITPTTPLQTNVCPVAGSVGRVRDGAEVAGPLQRGRHDRGVQERTGRLPQAGVGAEEERLVAPRSDRRAVPPNWLRLSGGVASSEPHSLAFIFPSRKYSNAEPL